MTLQDNIDKEAENMAYEAYDKFRIAISDVSFIASKVRIKAENYDGNIAHYISTYKPKETIDSLTKYYKDQLSDTLYNKLKRME